MPAEISAHAEKATKCLDAVASTPLSWDLASSDLGIESVEERRNSLANLDFRLEIHYAGLSHGGQCNTEHNCSLPAEVCREVRGRRENRPDWQSGWR